MTDHTQNAPKIEKGLNGIYVDSTTISHQSPETSSLTYRGYTAPNLADNCSFEEVVYLIWHGELPTAQQLKDFTAKERSARALPQDLMSVLKQLRKETHPMDVLRTAISFIGAQDPNWADQSREANMQKALNILAKIPTIITTSFRLSQGQQPLEPRSELSFAQNFLYMYFGEVPDERIVKAFDASLIFYAEHGFNASTFTARVITSTLSDIYSAVTGAIGALKGPLHGGANEEVMNMLLEIGDPAKAQAWIDDALATKKNVVMGFGHRVYRNGDSRVPYLTKMFHQIAELKDGQKWVEISNILSTTMIERKKIYPNVDFPIGPSYYLMGLNALVYTPILVMARVTGWCAHVMEQLEGNKIIRPLAYYNGVEQRTVTPIEDRKAA